MGFSLKQMLTPPKSIRKFQPKKLGNTSWWKDFVKDMAIPTIGVGTMLGLAGGGGGGIGSIFEKLKGGKAGGALKSGAGLLASKGGAGGLLKTGLGLLTGYQGYKGAQQAGRDQATAREHANSASELQLQAARVAQDRYNMNSPLRDAFRLGAFNMADPTNPFARENIFSQFQNRLQQESAPAPPPLLAKPQSNAPEAQGMRGRIEGGRKATPGSAPVQRGASVKGGRSVLDDFFGDRAQLRSF